MQISCELSLGGQAFFVPGISGFKAPHGLALAALVFARCFGQGDSLTLTIKEVLTLKFSNRSNECEHELPGGGAGVDVLLIGDQRYALAQAAAGHSTPDMTLRYYVKGRTGTAESKNTVTRLYTEEPN